MVNSFQQATLSSRLGIPIMYGIDAVHGHNGVYNATIFLNNVGLGATRRKYMRGGSKLCFHKLPMPFGDIGG